MLRRVLPSEGFYSGITVDASDSVAQVFFATVEELEGWCLRIDGNYYNVYYAFSTFKLRGSRKQTNMHRTKVLALDIDCAPEKVNIPNEPDKGYANQKLGLAALLGFIKTTGLPPPLIISSVRGLHVYWVLDRDLPPEEWQPLANGLKKLCQDHGLILDPSVTADGSRVLRPLNTRNIKNGAYTKVLLDSPDTTVAVMNNLLLGAGAVPGPGTAPTGLLRTAANSSVLAAMAVPTDFPPANSSLIETKCLQIEWATKKINQPKVSEPLWYGLLGVAAFCVDPEATAKRWSEHHPKYSEPETVKKLHQWAANATGPTTCSRFQQERTKGCDGCLFRDRITSPAALGSSIKQKSVEINAPDKLAKDVPLPYGFRQTERGIRQDIDGIEVDLVPFHIYPVSYGRDESLGYETVRFKWNRPHIGWTDLSFRQAFLNQKAGGEFASSLADQGIVLGTDRKIGSFQYMLRAYMDNLRSLRTMTNIHGSMGWKEEYTQFVIGNRVHKKLPDGSIVTEDTSLTNSARKVSDNRYTTSGTVAAWLAGTKFLDKANMPWHKFALNNTYSAPLWSLQGLKGMTISLHGGTGGGKSIAQLWIQSMWGNPGELHFPAKFTQNALFSRIGTYCHLPVTIDEATNMDKVGEFCYWVTEGRDKGRLSRNADEQVSKEWATSVTISTNKSWVGKLNSDGLDAEAQMMRLFEVSIPVHHQFNKSSNTGRIIANHLKDNHGMIGDAYAKVLLMLGPDEILRRINDTANKFSGLYSFKFSGPERYWEAMLILQHVACEIAEQHGLIGYDWRSGIRWAIQQIDSMRRTVKDNTTSGFRLIHEYLNEIAADTLRVMHTGNMPPAVDMNRLPRGQVKARYDVFRNSSVDKFDRGTVMIPRRAFKEWVFSRGYDFGALTDEIDGAGLNATPNGKRFVMGRDTSLPLGQQYVIGINLAHPLMDGFLDYEDRDDDDDTSEMDKLTEEV